MGLDWLCLIDQIISVAPEGSVSFWSQDRAGNITEGEISLLPDRRQANSALKLACSGLGDSLSHLDNLTLKSYKKNILFNIICLSCFFPEELTPVQVTLEELTSEELVTPDKEILLVGKIESQNEIRRIKLKIGHKSRELFNTDKIEKNRQKLFQEIHRQDHSKKYTQTLKDILQGNTIYNLYQIITIREELTCLSLVVEDKLGNIKSKQFCVRKIPREDIFKSEQRMTLAIIPFDVELDRTQEDNVCDYDQDYIYHELIKSFTYQGRFNLIEQKELPWDIIEKECRMGKICSEYVAQAIGEMTSAEGIVCGNIRKLADGQIEIQAGFREVEMGKVCLAHDVYSSEYELKNYIFTLADKFRASFPLHTGTIFSKDGQIIHVDLGLEKGLFAGMMYNIFDNNKERELIGKANIKEVKQGFSRAMISEKEKSGKVKEKYRVKVR